jgi:hypothetical protein
MMQPKGHAVNDYTKSTFNKTAAAHTPSRDATPNAAGPSQDAALFDTDSSSESSATTEEDANDIYDPALFSRNSTPFDWRNYEEVVNGADPAHVEMPQNAWENPQNAEQQALDVQIGMEQIEHDLQMLADNEAADAAPNAVPMPFIPAYDEGIFEPRTNAEIDALAALF